MAASPDARDQRRRDATFVWVSTGRRAAAARVGRRWHDVRGPLVVAAGLAVVQAGQVYLALRAIQELGLSLWLLVPVVAATTLALVLWMGLVRHAFGAVVPLGQAPAARILEVVEAARPALREGLAAPSARILAEEAHGRLGYGAVAVTDRGRVLAHVGLGGDHHAAGTPAPPGAVAAMVEQRVARLPVGWRHGCDGRDCPLRSAVAEAFAWTSSSPTMSSVETSPASVWATARSRSETASAPSENRISEPIVPVCTAIGATTAERNGQSRPSQPCRQPSGSRATRCSTIAATAPGGAGVPAAWWSPPSPTWASTRPRSVTATAP